MGKTVFKDNEDTATSSDLVGPQVEFFLDYSGEKGISSYNTLVFYL